MRKTLLSLLFLPLLAATPVNAQRTLWPTPAGSVKWTGGFWGDRFSVFSQTSVQSMWETWQTKEGKGFNNFLIASGEMQGEHHGPPFHDGDMYKWLEAVASVYAVNKDPELDKIMDRFIGCVVKAQRSDGYIHTPVIIAEMNKNRESTGDNTVVGTAVGGKDDTAFGNRLNFETYNLGHLITAGIVHRRATGKTTLFQAAVKAADFLCDFCNRAPEELAGNAICPSHYMAVAELYRETGNKKYLDLLRQFIDIRGMVENGTDDNQDRIPFRQQYKAMGHAVRANYLYAGVADLYLESGEKQLMANLDSIWHDIVNRKMYINGACGALYDGTSPDGTDYKPENIQKVHQSYGRPYQLPQSTAHNETCANIGNLLFNWRMFEATGDGKYADIIENCLYNSILCGISIDGEKYFYTNPLRISRHLPYQLRWPKERKKLISCFCCPPNTLRTLCQAQEYAYATADNNLWVNLFGENTLTLRPDGRHPFTLAQHTNYPWEGHVVMEVTQARKSVPLVLRLRIPQWCPEVNISVNGHPVPFGRENGYAVVNGNWKKGDIITYDMAMPTRIIEANPLVEESRGQVAVQRGPIVYCAESPDLNGTDIDHVTLPVDARFTPVSQQIDGMTVTALQTTAVVRPQNSWTGTLYREVSTAKEQKTIRLIPYFAWGNRGQSEMTVWMPAAY